MGLREYNTESGKYYVLSSPYFSIAGILLVGIFFDIEKVDLFIYIFFRKISVYLATLILVYMVGALSFYSSVRKGRGLRGFTLMDTPDLSDVLIS